MEATTGCGLDEVEHIFAITECQEHRCDCAHLHTQVTEEQRDVGDARKLKQNRADPLRTRRCFNIHELFCGQNKWNFVGETAKPIDSVNQRSDLWKCANFCEFFVTTMHIATRWLSPHNLLTVEARNDA